MNIDKKPTALIIIIISYNIIIHKGKSSLYMYAIVYLVSSHAWSTSGFIGSVKNSSHRLASSPHIYTPCYLLLALLSPKPTRAHIIQFTVY